MKHLVIALSVVFLVRPAAAQKTLAEGMADLAVQVGTSTTKAQKERIGVLAFRQLDGQDSVLGTYISEELLSHLITSGHKVVERQLLAKVLTELRVQATDVMDPVAAKELGRLTGVDAIVTGAITDLGLTIGINCRVIETLTGQVFAAAHIRITKDDDVKKIMTIESPMSLGPARTLESKVRAAVTAATSGKAVAPDIYVSPDGHVTVNAVSVERPQALATTIASLDTSGIETVVINGTIYYSRPSGEDKLPSFPWPPPTPSCAYEIPRALFGLNANSTIGDLVGSLSDTLSRAGHDSSRLFSAPDGVALVTRLEQIDEDGVPVSGAHRWTVDDIATAKEFSISGYLQALLRGKKGLYRAIVIVITTSSIPLSGKSLPEAKLKDLAASGALALPSTLSRRKLLSDHRTWALIYEFERREADANPISVVPGRLSAKQHLRRAGVLSRPGSQ